MNETALAAILAVANVVQIICLAWIAAWQQRAAQQVRQLNGAVETEIRALARSTSSGGLRQYPSSSGPD